MTPWSVMATASWPSSFTRLTSLLIRQAPSRRENSVCRCRWTKDMVVLLFSAFTEGFRPAGRVSFSAMGKKPKNRQGPPFGGLFGWNIAAASVSQLRLALPSRRRLVLGCRARPPGRAAYICGPASVRPLREEHDRLLIRRRGGPCGRPRAGLGPAPTKRREGFYISRRGGS